MTNNTMPASSGHPNSRHTFLTGGAVIARFDWGRTYGYRMLFSTGFPRAIGGRYRLDTLLQWEDRVLSGELPGRPDVSAQTSTSPTSGVEVVPTHLQDPTPAQPAADPASTDPALTVRVVAPTRRRTRGSRGTRRAA